MTGAARLEARITEAPGLSLLCPKSGVSQRVSDTESAQTHNSTPPAPSPRRARRRQRPRRLPAYGRADELLAVPRRLWWRWYTWTHSQRPAHPSEFRYAQHLTEHADERGRVVDIAAVIEGYAHWHHVSTRTGWVDHARVEARGRLRETLTPTCGRKAAYQLCVDPAELDLEAMPVELAHEFVRLFGLPVEGHQDDAGEVGPAQSPLVDESRELGPVPGSLAEQHALLAECEVVRLGGASQRCGDSAGSCGRLHTHPFPKKLFSPTLQSKQSHRRQPRPEGEISNNEKAAAELIMRRCWASWAAQRSHERYGPPLSHDQWAQLVPLVVYALRHTDHPSDVVEELTDRIASARHLPTLLAFRCRRLIRRGWHPSAPPAPRPPTPEIASARHRAERAARAGPDTLARTAARRDELRGELAAKRPLARPRPAPLVTAWAVEPEPAPTASLGSLLAEERAQRARHARALQRARRE